MWFWKKRQDYRKINIDETVTDIEIYISKTEKEEREKLLYEQGKKEVDFSENSKKIKPKPHKAILRIELNELNSIAKLYVCEPSFYKYEEINETNR